MRPRRVEGQKVYLLLYEMFLEGSSHALGYGGQNELVHWDEITEPGGICIKPFSRSQTTDSQNLPVCEWEKAFWDVPSQKSFAK